MAKLPEVLFVGSKQLGLSCLKELYKLEPSALQAAIVLDDTTDTRSVLSEYKKFCIPNSIPIFIVSSRKESEDVMIRLKPDLGIVIGWYWIISTSIIRKSKLGYIGLHNSLLPQYRGVSPLNWAIINGDKQTGISLFSLTEEMDKGDIWAQRKVEIKKTDYIGDILRKIETQAIQMMNEVYIGILEGTIKPKPQNDSNATYCIGRTPKDGNIDWTQPAEKIYNFIRAQSKPYPGAFAYLNDKKITIWKSIPTATAYYGVPGTVARINSEGVLVVCGGGTALLLQDVKVGTHEGNAATFITSLKSRFVSDTSL